MDDYNPLDAFIDFSESSHDADDGKSDRTDSSYRLSQKRSLNEISEDTIVDEKESLKAGLNKPIAKDSFGMRMLEKMGFKQGGGLGKDGNGIKEPIQIKVKSNKQGIGSEESERRRKEEENYNRNLKIIRDQLLYNMRKQQFAERVKERENQKSVIRDLRQAQFAIEVLDEKHGRSSNPLLIADDDECDIDVLSMHLRKMIEYLRSTYFYCIYCGCEYNDEQDLASSCPGWTRDVH